MNLRQWILDKTRPKDAIKYGDKWFVPGHRGYTGSSSFKESIMYEFKYTRIKPKWFIWVECTEWLSTNEKLGE